MIMTRTDCKRGARITAAFLLCVFVMANMAELFHQASVEHTICPEHGDASHHSAEDEDAPEAQEGLSSSHESEHGCDHCSMVLAPREGLVSHHTTGTFDSPPSPAVQTALAPRAPQYFTSRLYRLAPKTSPPASA